MHGGDINPKLCYSSAFLYLADFSFQTGHCSFDDSFCSLKYDWNATFQWTITSGKTPTENTGPRYDHTTFSKDGKDYVQD